MTAARSRTRRGVTLDDVARRAGVSPKTVSRVVKNEGGYTEETAARVRAAVAEVDYHPNLLARGLSSGRSGTVGLVGVDFDDPFFPEIAAAIQRVAHEHGLTLFLAATYDDPELQRSALNSLRSHGVDGVIVLPAIDTDHDLRAFAQTGTATVALTSVADDLGVMRANADVGRGAELAAEHLVATGRRRLAMISRENAVDDSRLLGFRRAVPDDLDVVVEPAPPTAEGGRIAMGELLRRAPDLDGVFAYNDLMALGALRRLAVEGRRVPDDVAVIGFNDIKIAETVTPTLTTIRIDRRAVAEAAIRLLLQRLDAPDAPDDSTALPVELIVRESA